MNCILQLLRDQHDNLRPIADVFADEDAVERLYDAFYDCFDGSCLPSWYTLDHGDFANVAVEYGFVPTDWEAALLIETELEQHYGCNAVERFFTDWNERIVDSVTLQPTDEDRAAESLREVDQYAEHHDRCYTD